MTQVSLFAGAKISDDGVFRYRLWREWDGTRGRVLWVMFNPSTADATQDDPTIRRCVRFAQAWGYGAIDVVNLFALRSTDPSVVLTHSAPVGPENDAVIVDAVRSADRVIAAWGGLGPFHVARAQKVADLLRSIRPMHTLCLATTVSGHPRHPLYVRGDIEPKPFRWGTR